MFRFSFNSYLVHKTGIKHVLRIPHIWRLRCSYIGCIHILTNPKSGFTPGIFSGQTQIFSRHVSQMVAFAKYPFVRLIHVAQVSGHTWQTSPASKSNCRGQETQSERAKQIRQVWHCDTRMARMQLPANLAISPWRAYGEQSQPQTRKRAFCLMKECFPYANKEHMYLGRAPFFACGWGWGGTPIPSKGLDLQWPRQNTSTREPPEKEGPPGLCRPQNHPSSKGSKQSQNKKC